MSGYNIECFLYDFSKRTTKNLEIINGIKDGSFGEMDLYRLRRNPRDNYEVTQLINSLLGLVIIPVEASKKLFVDDGRIFFPDFFSISEEDSKMVLDLIDTCKKEKRYYSSYPHNQNKNRKIGFFIYHIRNSLAHGGAGGVHFYPIQERQEITDIIFYDHNDEKKQEFCIKLSIDEIRDLEYNINNLLCGFEEREKNIKEKINNYQDKINELEEKMRNYHA